MGRRRVSLGPMGGPFRWVRKQSAKEKAFLGIAAALVVLAAMKLLVRDHNHFFVAAEAVHAAGILVLVYKLTTQKTCSGLSLKAQELTAIFLAVRLYCSIIFEKDIHTVLDFATLASTLWVIYMMRYQLKSTYIEELDNLPRYYVLCPCILLSILVHPYSQLALYNRIFWAFSVYLESVSVLPQLCLMQNAKMVEPFTAHYIFALGVARFLGCAHWIILLIDTHGGFLMGSGFFWLPASFISEIIQTFILADFCYYYAKSAISGQLLVRLPSVAMSEVQE